METLFDILTFIFDLIVQILTWAPASEDGVQLALGPLAIAGIGLLGGAAMGGINHLLGKKERNRLARREGRAESRMDAINQYLGAELGNIKNRAAGIDDNMTMEELFGTEIQTLTDRAQEGQAGMSAQLAKAVAAGGGDISGSMATTLQRLSESTNRSIQDIMNDYSMRTERRNLQEASRKDNLMMSVLAGRENQLGFATGQYNRASDRRTAKATADKQFLLDSLGLGANVASMAIGAPGG